MKAQWAILRLRAAAGSDLTAHGGGGAARRRRRGFGDLWMWLRLICGCNLRVSEVLSGSFGVDLGPKGPPLDPDRTLDNSKLQSHEL